MTKNFDDIKDFTLAKLKTYEKGDVWRHFWEMFHELASNDKGYLNFGHAQASFFMKSSGTFVNETAYHTACRPSHCQFLEKSRVNIYFIVGVLVGIAGTMSEVLRVICEKMAHYQIEKDMKHQLPAVASDSEQNFDVKPSKVVKDNSKRLEMQLNPMKKK
eukprot:g6977.t1